MYSRLPGMSITHPSPKSKPHVAARAFYIEAHDGLWQDPGRLGRDSPNCDSFFGMRVVTKGSTLKLIAIRHGETEWNTQNRVMGQLDSPLTPQGIQQAHAIAARLSKQAFHALYSSDLGRAMRTAEIIASVCGKPVTCDTGLRERNMGIFQGLTVEEMHKKFPNERRDYEHIGFEYVVPQGESAKQRTERSLNVMTAIAERHPDEIIVVVTHGGFLMGFFESVLGMTPGNGWRFKRSNASYSVFEYTNSRWSLDVWNDVSHLENSRALDDPTIQDM